MPSASDTAPTPTAAPAPRPPITTEASVSIVPLTCARCQGPIPAGERHLRHTDHRAPRRARFAECAACARRGGRGDALGR